MTTHELAWAAGFFDGEGSVFLSAKKQPRLNIGQNDRAVLDRFLAAVGVGRVNGPYRGKDFYYFQTTTFEKTQAVIALLWKYLSPVKRAQAARVLMEHKAVLAARPRTRHWATCAKGHTDRKLRADGSLWCRTCARESRKS